MTPATGWPTTGRAMIAGSACLFLAAAGAGGCSRVSASDGASSGNRCLAAPFAEPFSTIDPCSAPHVAIAVLQTVFTYHPGEQADQRASFRAAMPLMDDGFAAHWDTTGAVLAPITSMQWQRWSRLGIDVTATARLGDDDHPPDSDTTFARVAAVDLHPPDGPQLCLAVYIRATRPSSAVGWRISALEART